MYFCRQQNGVVKNKDARFVTCVKTLSVDTENWKKGQKLREINLKL